MYLIVNIIDIGPLTMLAKKIAQNCSFPPIVFPILKNFLVCQKIVKLINLITIIIVKAPTIKVKGSSFAFVSKSFRVRPLIANIKILHPSLIICNVKLGKC